MTLEATNLRETVRTDGKSGALNVNRFFFFCSNNGNLVVRRKIKEGRVSVNGWYAMSK